MNRVKVSVAICAFFLGATAVVALADKLKLTNGAVLESRIVEQSDDAVTIETRRIQMTLPD